MGVLDKFLDVMKLNSDDDEYDDDFYDEDDDFEDESYEEEKPKKNIFGKKDKPAAYEEEEEDYQLKKSGRSNKVTPMRQPSTRRNAPAMEVCVIKPNAMDDTREITETLLAGRTVILNLEGMDLEIAQRIIAELRNQVAAATSPAEAMRASLSCNCYARHKAWRSHLRYWSQCD